LENFGSNFTLLAEDEGIGLNLIFSETGLINILALSQILVYTGRDFLGSVLEERKQTIVKVFKMQKIVLLKLKHV
jgi:F-type H+-transporting ATPase subunit b